MKSAVDLVFLVQTGHVKFDVVVGWLSNCFTLSGSGQSPVVVVLLFLLAHICGLVNASAVLNPGEGNEPVVAFAGVKSCSSWGNWIFYC